MEKNTKYLWHLSSIVKIKKKKTENIGKNLILPDLP